MFCFFFSCLLLLLCFHFIYFYLPPPPPPPLLHMLLDSFIIFRIYFTVLFTEGRTFARVRSFARLFGEISIWCIYSIFWRFAQIVFRAEVRRQSHHIGYNQCVSFITSSCYGGCFLRWSNGVVACFVQRKEFIMCHRREMETLISAEKAEEKKLFGIFGVYVCVHLMSTAASSHCVQRKHTNR